MQTKDWLEHFETTKMDFPLAIYVKVPGEEIYHRVGDTYTWFQEGHKVATLNNYFVLPCDPNDELVKGEVKTCPLVTYVWWKEFVQGMQPETALGLTEIALLNFQMLGEFSMLERPNKIQHILEQHMVHVPGLDPKELNKNVLLHNVRVKRVLAFFN